jgi:hypothetical protein
VVADTVAWFVMDPVVVGVTLIVIVAVAPLARVPTEHVTVPEDGGEQVPWVLVADTKFTPDGNVSLTDTPAALEGPALLTPSVYVSSLPWSTGSGESDLVIARLAAGSTVVAALAVLLPVVRSVTADEALAEFVIDPVDCGVTTIWTLALAPLLMVPSGHVTVPAACEQVPCDGVAELNVTPAGTVSRRVG